MSTPPEGGWVMRNRYTQTNIEVIEYHFGDIIERIIMTHNYPVDLDEDYDHLMRFIYRTIKRTWFRNREPTPKELEERILHVKKKYKDKLMIMLSYIVARYSNMRGEETTDYRTP